MQVCQEALDLNLTDQLLYQDELKNKFQQMQTTLGPLLDIQEEVRESNVRVIPSFLHPGIYFLFCACDVLCKRKSLRDGSMSVMSLFHFSVHTCPTAAATSLS